LSPYFNRESEKLKFKMCLFNKKIYCHSNKISRQKLMASMSTLFKGQTTFVVPIKSMKSKEKEIYNPYRLFIKKMINQ
jgi:hypothetical protein